MDIFNAKSYGRSVNEPSVKHNWHLSQNHAYVNRSTLENHLLFINFGYHPHHFVFIKIDQFL